MTNPYPQTFSEYTKYDFGNVSEGGMIFESSSIDIHEDIPEFEFSTLDKIKKDLLASGHSVEEVNEVIAGLSELPEYATSRRNTTSKKTN